MSLMNLTVQMRSALFQQILRLLRQRQYGLRADGAIRMTRCLSAQRIQPRFNVGYRLTIGQVAEQIQ